MCNGLIGKKVGMTGLFLSDGVYVPVTVVQAGPCVVAQIKTKATDGYNALQLGYGEKKKNRIKKPIQGHLKKSGDVSCAHFREFQVDNPDEYSLGQKNYRRYFYGRRKRGCFGKNQGQRIFRCHQTARFPRRQKNPWQP